MKKTMIYLPDELHEGLRILAFEHRTSTAELIRRALEAAYGEILEDIRDGEAELATYMQDRTTAISLEEFLAQQELNVPNRSRVAGSTRT